MQHLKNFLLSFLVVGVFLRPGLGYDPTESPLGVEVENPDIQKENPRVILPHRQNYILPIAYGKNLNEGPFQRAGRPFEMQNLEVKFQMSLKFPVVRGAFNNYGTIYFAYTQLSLWQAYNDEHSRPFRETNYEPEVFFAFPVDIYLEGPTLRQWGAGISHESNGRSEKALSRGWNRIYGYVNVEAGPAVFQIRPWYRIPESSGSDQNPNIEKYMGYGELVGAFKFGSNVFSAMVRNNLRANDNKGALEVGWSYPLKDQTRFYIQYFTGYGETLVDYNVPVDRYSIGFIFTDWL